LLDIGQARHVLSEQFPNLEIDHIEVVDTGGDHYTVAVGEDLVFRFPNDASVAEKTRLEMALLADLRPNLPLAVPAVLYAGRPSASYPHPFTGQARLPGVMGELLRPARDLWPGLAKQLGEFLTALHAFPQERAEGLGLARRPLEPPERLVAETLRHRGLISQELPDLVSDEAAAYLSGSVPLPLVAHMPAVTSHADLNVEHILVSLTGDSITGIVDWSDAALCDPVVDLGALLIWLGPGFLRLVLEHYADAVDAHIFDRAVAYERYGCLRRLGRRLAGLSDDPLDLIITQLRWAFADR